MSDDWSPEFPGEPTPAQRRSRARAFVQLVLAAPALLLFRLAACELARDRAQADRTARRWAALTARAEGVAGETVLGYRQAGRSSDHLPVRRVVFTTESGRTVGFEAAGAAAGEKFEVHYDPTDPGNHAVGSPPDGASRSFGAIVPIGGGVYFFSWPI